MTRGFALFQIFAPKN